MKRPSWDDYFIEVASVIAKRGTCLRRVYGAVIVKDNRIVSTGYNGAPIGEKNCNDIGICTRQELGIPSGERYELCRSVHAEQNAIIQGNPSIMEGATLYISGWDYELPHIEVTGMDECGREFNENIPSCAEAHPCKMCSRMIKNAKIKEIVWRAKGGEIKKKLVSEME